MALLNLKPLREQVYDYLRDQIHSGAISGGSLINIQELSRVLGISTTPLRDALIHLEMEGFVTILPRKGVQVKRLTIEEVAQAFHFIGMVEAAMVTEHFDRITLAHIQALDDLNQTIRSDIQNNDFHRLSKLNLEFHRVYTDLSDNDLEKKMLHPVMQRLYDFSGKHFFQEWEEKNCREHDRLIDCFKAGKPAQAAALLKDTHWSFEANKTFIEAIFNTLSARSPDTVSQDRVVTPR